MTYYMSSGTLNTTHSLTIAVVIGKCNLVTAVFITSVAVQHTVLCSVQSSILILDLDVLILGIGIAKSPSIGYWVPILVSS